MANKTTIRELLSMEIDIDVADDYDERLMIAFCGPVTLTREGTQKFGELLDWEVDIEMSDTFGNWAVVHCDTGKQASKAQKLFESMAGYCADSDYDKWFII